MVKPNHRFELSLEDIDLIDSALSSEIMTLSQRRWTHPNEHKLIDARIKAIHELLGKIHNQKVWYRPKKNYVGG